MSERTGPIWYDRSDYMIAYVILAWPIALYGLYRRDDWDEDADQWMLAGCLVMAAVWSYLFQMI
jgi:hypothetical protein